jgi:hypothetical protein
VESVGVGARTTGSSRSDRPPMIVSRQYQTRRSRGDVMAEERPREIIRQGVAAWNRWRERNPDVRPDLVGVDLHEAALDHVDLSDALISGANLSRTHLQAKRSQRKKISNAPVRRFH